MNASVSLSPTAIALNRFGLGARPDDAPLHNPKAWLLGQFDRYQPMPAAFAALPDAGNLVATYLAERRQARRSTMPMLMPAQPLPIAPRPQKTDQMKGLRQDYGQDVQALYRQAVQARAESALETQSPFIERLVHFWSNHFCVSVDNREVTAFAGTFERDAIRPHVLGRFEDMLLAVERHPAMLIYLNQVQSIGPDSPAAERNGRRRRGLNENLGREIMELHTLGVRSGYTQADVTEFARALTGWTVDGIGPGNAMGSSRPGTFIFRPQLHEPGPRTILGRSYPQDGEAQARAALLDFAHAPVTANHVATKLARHFAGDSPPPALVDRLATAFRTSKGDLSALYRALISSPEPWLSRPLKFKTPWEWTISALRGIGRTEVGPLQMAAVQSQLGQPVWKPGSPAGWDDSAASWAGPDALLRRVEFAQRLAAQVGDRVDARRLVPQLMPASFNPATAQEIGRAESPAGALALLLASPDFLRR